MSGSPTRAASPRRAARSSQSERKRLVTYWEHEGIYFRLIDGLLDAVRRKGVWLGPTNTSYVGLDVRTYGSRVSQAEAERH